MDKNETVEANNKRLAWVFLPESGWNFVQDADKTRCSDDDDANQYVDQEKSRIWIVIVGR
jgi:hypothetical protein